MRLNSKSLRLASIAAVLLNAALALSACSGLGAPKGAGFLRIVELTGSCSCTTATGPTGVDQFAGLSYRRAHASIAFEGGGAFVGGNLIAGGWQDPDGNIGRIQVDIGPDRGFGITSFPEAVPGPTGMEGPQAALSQAFGYVEWKGGARAFAAQKVWGIVNYVADTTPSDSPLAQFDTSTTMSPLELYAHVAVDGIGPMGEPLCRVLALHAAADHERTEPYDPSWLAASPSALVVDAAGAPLPTYAADAQPTAKLVPASTAAANPGGDPPRLDHHAPIYAPGGGGGGGGGDDGSGDCD